MPFAADRVATPVSIQRGAAGQWRALPDAEPVLREGTDLLFDPDAGVRSATHSGYSPTTSVQYFFPDGDVAEARP